MSYHGIAPVDVTPGGSGSYLDVDVSAHVPSGATVALLRIRSTDSGSDRKWGVRRKGSTDDFYHDLDSLAQTSAFVGLDAAKRFQAKIESARVRIELTGWLEGEAVWLDSAIDVTPAGSSGSFRPVSIAAHTGANTSVAAMLLFYPASASTFARPAGGTDELHALCENVQPFLVGLDETESFEFWTLYSGQKVWLLGYLTAGYTAEAAAVEVTPAADDSWEDQALPEGGLGVAIWAHPTSASRDTFGARKDGSADDWVTRTNANVGFLITAAAAGAYETWRGASWVRLYRLGHFTEVLAAQHAIAGAATASVAVAATLAYQPDHPRIAGQVAVAATPAATFRLATAVGVEPEAAICVTLRPYDETLALTLPGLPAPFLVAPFLEGADFAAAGGETAIHLSDVGYTSRPDDDPPNRHFEARLNPSFSIESRLFSGDRPSGRSQAAFGAIAVKNGDGWLDPYLGLGYDGRDVEIRKGPKRGSFRRFETVFRGTAEGWSWTENEAVLSLYDRQLVLDRPIQPRLYPGTGGAGGGSDLAGLPIPLLLGEARNLEPVLRDVSRRIYQLNDGRMFALDAVRDKGVALTPAGDIATLGLEAVEDWTPVEGAYVTDLARGLFRLGAEPIGTITCDARGAVGPRGYAATTGEIARLIASRLAAVLGITDPEGIDTAAFDALEAAQPAPVGIYVARDRPSAGNVLDRLLAAIGGWWGFTRTGLLTVGILGEPGSPDVSIAADEIATPGPRMVRAGRPVWRTRVEWGRNWRPQTADDLSEELSIADRAFYSQAQRFATASDGTVRSKHRLAEDRTVEAFFVNQDDAAAEAARQQALFGTLRRVFSVPVTRPPFELALGETVALDVAGDAGSRLDLPRSFALIGLVENAADGTVDLELWG